METKPKIPVIGDYVRNIGTGGNTKWMVTLCILVRSTIQKVNE